ncbi:MAG: hypothetical protein ACFFCI_17540 [Promethearchaeota archaeon]
MFESRTYDRPVSWHWTEVSKEAILRKSASIRRIRNKRNKERKIHFQGK